MDLYFLGFLTATLIQLLVVLVQMRSMKRSDKSLCSNVSKLACDVRGVSPVAALDKSTG